ncbi:T9SS type B sorting domain-containing protein [Capnocytophaga sp.]|uniref:T9SS type B sorting domain-containing protein n=1 Tax=Capnocytophaga sp. TaxID=44737 RepID=UPI0026DAD6CB|nr:T9SS type B sorting domain-containing protein [Capnocytophaga sp.]MDO5105190.1 T9SS type B sorting domain-containing protein [Capnocytophaga sp.]
MGRFLFTFVFLLTTLMVKGQQCYENFTGTPTAGSCLSNASLTVKVPDGCTGNFAVELIEPNQVGLPSAPLLDSNGSYTFTNLKAGTYTVTVIDQATSRRSAPKAFQVTSTYRNIDITAPQITAPTPAGNDARVRFNIRPTGGIGPFKVSLAKADGTPLNVPSQQIPKSTTNVLVTFQGTAAEPIATGNVIIVIEDLANNVPDCGEIRKEPVQIPVPDPSNHFQIIKNGEVSRIRTNSDCKHQFWIRIDKPDRSHLTPANVQYFRQSGTAIVRNLTTGVEYDISHTFVDGQITEGNSFYTGYDFNVGDEVEVIIQGPANTIHEKFTLTQQLMNPMFSHPNDPRAPNNIPVYLYNTSNRACDPNEWTLAVGEYWMWRQFPNDADPAKPAEYGRYEWYQTLRYDWINEAQRLAGQTGYYYEVYRGTSNAGPWTKLVHGVDYRQETATVITLMAPVTSQGPAFFRVVYKNNSTKPGNASCFEPERINYIRKIQGDYLNRAFENLEIGAGVFENTVSYRLYISATRFVYPAKMTVMPADGSTSKTFTTSLPLDGTNTHQRTVKFPIVEDIKDPAIEVPKISYTVKGDIPAGEYDFTLEDACGRKVTKRINLRSPSKYDGDFVKIDQGCQYASVSYDLKTNYPGTYKYMTISVHRKTASGWVQAANQPSYLRTPTGTFYNLPPGEYRLHVTNLMYAMVERLVWIIANNATGGLDNYTITPITGGYSDGFTVIEPWDTFLRNPATPWLRGLNRYISNYHEFTIKETAPLQTDVSATYCERTSGNGLVVVSVKNPDNIRYPLTFRLKNNAGTVVGTQTYDGTLGATSHIFTNIADGDYIVETEHRCGKWFNNVTVKASNYANPTATNVPGVFDPCLGGNVTLVFGGSDQLFDIEWFKIDANGNKILPSVGTGKTVVQSVSTTTTYRAEYKIKPSVNVCPGTALEGSADTTVRFTPDTTAPVIADCPSTITVNAAVGACSAVVTWKAITATDNCTFTQTQTHQSGDSFDIGTHTVTYVFTDAAGNTSTCTFNVIVNSNAIDMDVTAAYVDGTGATLSGDLTLNQQFQYKIDYKNVGEENITTSTLTITFADNPYITIGTPVVTYASVGSFVPTYTNVGRTYTFVLPKETLQGKGDLRTIYIPLTVTGDYQEIGKACMNHFATNHLFEYEGGNQQCLIPKQTKTATNTILISTEDNHRSELFCAGASLEFTVAQGFDSYRWYKDGVLIPSATSHSYTANAPGVYVVEKITHCGGVEIINKETINFQEHNSLNGDPIRAQANGGATCGADGRWISHFILCNEPSRIIKVNYVNTQLVWERYHGTSTDERCPDYGGTWSTDAAGVGNTFTASTQGRYRLKVVSSNGCEAYFYFNVYMNTLAGEIVQPVGHITDYQPGNFTVRMVTEGISYRYTLRDASGQIVNGINNTTGTHEYRVTGISDPGTYTIEVTSPNLTNCSTLLTAVIQKQTNLSATATPKAWTDCNVLNINFEVQGGLAPYQFAIWKIDGVQKYPDYASIPASEFNIATIPVGQNFIEQPVTITQPGKYIFVTKDANGAYAETPPVDIYPEGVDGYTINTRDIICGFAETSGQVSVTFNSSLQNIITELHRLDASGNRVQAYTPNSTGFYDGLVAGKYELEISIQKSGVKICKYLSPVEILKNENTLRAFAGVAEDASCDVNTPKRYKVHINNVSGGSGTGYVYSSNGVDYGTSNVLYVTEAVNKVYVKDSNGCPLEININIAPLTPPTFTLSNVEYGCSGKGTFTVTVTPPGAYEYEVVGNTVSERKSTNEFTLPEGNYTVYVHYKPGTASGTTPNYLFTEDFSTGDDACDNTVIYMTCKPNQVLDNGEYVITKQVQARPEWVVPTDGSGVANGRYLAVNANSNQGNLGIIYRKQLTDLVLGTDLKVSLKLHNLLAPTYTGGRNPDIQLVIINPVTNTVIKSVGLGQIPANGQWETKTAIFEAGFIASNDVVFEIRSVGAPSLTAGNDVAVDDITIWQDTKLCDIRLESQSVVIAENQAFKVSGTPEDAKCDNFGKLHLKIENRRGSALEYSTDNVTWMALPTTAVNANEDSAVVDNLPAVANATVYVRKQADPSCVGEVMYSISAPATMSITTALLRGVSCDVPSAQVRVTATGGTPPYQSFKIGATTVAATNNEAIFTAIPAGTHQVEVTDTNGCIATTTLEVADKLPLTLSVDNLENCFTGGETGRIQVSVTSGNGDYRFSRNGTDFYASPVVNGAYYIFEGLSAGNYTFTVKDALNCSATVTAIIYEPLRLNVQLADNLTCLAGSKAKFNLTTTGGDPSKVREFLWSNDNITFNTANVAGITLTTTGNTATFETEVEGTYYFRVRYDYGGVDYCAATSLRQEVKIRKPSFKSAPTATGITCGGTATGRIEVSVANIQGGEAPYTLELSDGTNTTTHPLGNITGLTAGTYTLIVKDDSGCASDPQSITINEVPALTVAITRTPVKCNARSGMDPGTATIQLQSGGTAPFSIEVRYKDVPHGTPVHQEANIVAGRSVQVNGLSPHDYTYQITDAAGCVTQGMFTIEGTSDQLRANVTGITANCVTGSINLEAYNAGGETIAEGTHWFALYTLGLTPPAGTPPTTGNTWVVGSTTWYRGATAVVTDAAGNPVNGVRVTIPDLVPGARYQFIVYDYTTKCYIIKEAGEVPPGTSQLNITANAVQTTCSNANDGKVTFTLSGLAATTTSISYRLYTTSDNQPTAYVGNNIPVATPMVINVTGLPANRYYAVFTEDQSGCRKASEPFVITKTLAELTITGVVTSNDNCHGGNGQISVEVKDGLAPYKFYYHDLASGAVPSGATLDALLNASTDGATKKVNGGNWVVFVRDAANCIKSESNIFVGTDNAPVLRSVVVENPCAEDTDFVVRVQLAQVGTGQHSYQVQGVSTWSDINIAQGVTSFVLPIRLPARNTPYTVVLKDGNGCTVTGTVTINSPINYQVASQPINCGVNMAIIDVMNITGGSGGYQYRVDKIDVLDDGSGNLTEVVTPIIPLTPAPSATYPVTVNQGAGTYRVRIFDVATQCFKSKDVVVAAPVQPTIEVVSVTNPICFGANGSLRVQAKPNTEAVFTFRITAANGATVTTPIAPTTSGNDYAVFENLPSSSTGVEYTIEAVSARNCSATVTATITSPSALTIAPDALVVSGYKCRANTNTPVLPIVSFDLDKVSGGTQSYTRVEFYEAGVATVLSSQVIVNGKTIYTYELPQHLTVPKSFNVKVYDANGCEATSADIQVLPALILSELTKVTDKAIDCNTNTEAMTVTLVTTTPYNNESIIYTVMKRNQNGSETVFASQTLNALTASFNLPVGNYTIVAINRDTDCEVKTTYDVHSPETFLLTATDAKQVKCHGGSDGEITLTFTDTRLSDGDQAAAGFSYVISPIAPSTGVTLNATVTGKVATVMGLSAGYYQAEATSIATGCKAVTSFEIVQNEAPITATASETFGVTCTNDRGEVMVTVNGGKSPYQVTLTSADGSVNQTKNGGDVTGNRGQFLFIGLKSDPVTKTLAYNVSVTDASGCVMTAVTTISLTHPDPITGVATVTQDISCTGANDGVITISNVAGGSGAGSYNYALIGTATSVTQSSTVFTNLPADTYKVFVTDAWNCDQEIATLTITEPTPITVNRTDADLTVCYGEKTAWINIQIQGGTAPYKAEVRRTDAPVNVYMETNILASDPHLRVPASLGVGTYEINVTDARGCSLSPTYTFEVKEVPDLMAQVTQEGTCEANTYKTWIEVRFRTDMDFSKLSYELGTGAKRTFSRHTNNIGYIDENVFSTMSGTQTLVIYYNDVDVVTTRPIQCTYTLVDAVDIQHTLPLDEIQVIPTTAINTIEVRGKDGVAPYTYIFNGQDQGENGVYKLRYTDPEEVINGKRYKVINVTVYDSAGCSKTKVIKEEYFDIEIPNFFTPDGDGNNDTWTPRNIEDFQYIRTHIYDRYGRRLATLEKDQAWDGRYNNRMVPTGDYWYIIELNSNTDSRTFKGNFTLYR